jgi:hypothetical protein
MLSMTMSSSLLRRVAWIAFAGALVLTTLPVKSADKRIVLIAGRPSHPPGMHEFRAGCLLFQKALTAVPGVNVQVYDMGWPAKTVDGARVDDSAALDNADAVLIYADGGKGHPAIQGDRLKVIEALAAKGVGLGFAHYGVEVPTGVPGDAMHKLIGGFYEDKFSVNPMWTPSFQKLPNHPLVPEAAEPSGHPWRRSVRHSRRVVLQHALGRRTGGQVAAHADPRRHAQ